MTDGVPWRDLFTLIGMIIGAVGSFSVAVVYLLSRARKAGDALQREYIANLEKARNEAERENKELRTEVGELRGAIRILQGMIMGRCSRFQLDPVTGGCAHCDLGLAYGGRQSVPSEAG